LNHKLRFLYAHKERIEWKEITGATLRNYVKTIKLFCEMNDIMIPWKKITRGLPRGWKYADDRASHLRIPPKIRFIIQIFSQVRYGTIPSFDG
jgi:hypothetical protein